jgi:predicted transcriptional regulator
LRPAQRKELEMNESLLRKKFQKEFEKWLEAERLSVGGAAWLLDCSERTIKNYSEGRTLPHRDFALLLCFFEPKLKEVLELIAGLPTAKLRRAELNRLAGDTTKRRAA